MKRILLIAIVLLSTIDVQVAQETHKITIDNTVVISNETDESFCRDFSPFLNIVSLDWVILKERNLPESVKEKNIIIIGGPDAEIVGNIVTDILSWKEERFFRNPGNYSVLEKESHWTDGKTIHLCCGFDRLLTKRAAEEGISSLMKKAHDPEKWINYSLSIVSLRDPQAYFSLVNTCWPTLHYSLPLLAGSEEYEKYAELGYVYTAPKVEEVIELCITKIDEEALNLKEEGDLEKSKDKYEFIITNLRDGRWNYEEDIKEYKSKKSDIEEIIRKRLIMELVIAGLCVVTLAVLVYRKRRVNPNREEM